VDPPSEPKVRNEAKKLINSVMLAKSTDIFHSCRGDGVRISICAPAGHSFFLHEFKDFATAEEPRARSSLAIGLLLHDAVMTADHIRIAVSDIHINPLAGQHNTRLTEINPETRKVTSNQINRSLKRRTYAFRSFSTPMNLFLNHF